MFGWQQLGEVLAAFGGTIGFGLLFNIRGKKLRLAGLGGGLAWLLFLLLGFVIENEVARYFIVSVVITLYAEILARILKTPASTFCIVSLIALIPGGGLYYSMAYALSGESTLFVEKAAYTLALAAALSLGIVLATAVTRHVTAALKKKS